MKYCKSLATFAGMFFFFTAFTQSGNVLSSEGSVFYAKIYGAYGLLTPGSFKGISNNDNNDVNVVQVHKKGMGGGIRAGAGVGVILNEFLNIGLDGEYLAGNKIKIEVNALEGASSKTQSLTTFEHQVVSVIPNIMFKAISRPGYYIYNRIGVVIGVPINMTEDEKYEYHYSNSLAARPNDLLQRDIYTTFNGKHALKTSVGYQGALGVQLLLGDKLRGFFEIAVYGLSMNRLNYRDIQRETKQTDVNKDGSSKTTSDNSRYFRNYVETGVTINAETIGTPGNYIYTSTSPHSSVNMNAITLGLGLAYRF